MSAELWRASCPARDGGSRVIQALSRDEAAQWYARNVLYRSGTVVSVTHEGRGWYGLTREVMGLPTDFPHHFRVVRPPVKEDRGVDERRGVEAVARALFPVYGPGWAVTELGTRGAAGPGRADLAFFTDSGLTIGAEIKTQRDSVTRLSIQVEKYEESFDACILACTPNHADNAVAVIPAHWGLALLNPDDHALKDVMRPAVTVRRGTFRVWDLMDELWGDELRRELRSRRIPMRHKKMPNRAMAALLVEKLGEEHCRDMALHVLGKLRREGKRVQAWRVEEP